MALTGNTVQSTYLDLVQLEKSGAGLPSHAGKEAAIYDGSGAQILGRTAVRHWLDPHPDAAAFAETWEFSTTGDMTQGQLESAGWTFANCTASVTGGLLVLVGAGGGFPKASLAVSFDGDFDIAVCPIVNQSYISNSSDLAIFYGGGGVGTNGGDAHYAVASHAGNTNTIYTYVNGTFASLAGTESAKAYTSGPIIVIRASRISGTVRVTGGGLYQAQFVVDDTEAAYHGFADNGATDVDSQTFDRLFICSYSKYAAPPAGSIFKFAFLRRFQ